jgi:hypothetical protein
MEWKWLSFTSMWEFIHWPRWKCHRTSVRIDGKPPKTWISYVLIQSRCNSTEPTSSVYNYEYPQLSHSVCHILCYLWLQLFSVHEVYHTNEVQVLPYARERYFLMSEYCIDEVPILNLDWDADSSNWGFVCVCMQERFCSVLQAYSGIST